LEEKERGIQRERERKRERERERERDRHSTDLDLSVGAIGSIAARQDMLVEPVPAVYISAGWLCHYRWFASKKKTKKKVKVTFLKKN